VEYSLKRAGAVTNLGVGIGALGVCLMTSGVFRILSGLGPSAWAPLVVSALLTVLVAWTLPALVAETTAESFVAFWVPLIGDVIARRLRQPVEPPEQPSEAHAGEPSDAAAEDEAREVFRSLLRLSKVSVADIMTPRTRMTFVRDTASLPEVIDAAHRSGHSRLPVFHESRDQIVGFVHVKDLLKRMLATDWKTATARDLVRKPFLVPETKRVDALLEDFQRERTHLGIVVDEYGGTSGLITIEDIIEELLGEIRDEHDREESGLFRRVAQDAYDLDGVTRLADLNEALDLNLPLDEDFGTLGGYVTFRLGRIPTPGETAEGDGVRLTVLDCDARRVKAVRLQVLRPNP
jgi:magnesium and cobalt transporter